MATRKKTDDLRFSGLEQHIEIVDRYLFVFFPVDQQVPIAIILFQSYQGVGVIFCGNAVGKGKGPKEKWMHP